MGEKHSFIPEERANPEEIEKSIGEYTTIYISLITSYTYDWYIERERHMFAQETYILKPNQFIDQEEMCKENKTLIDCFDLVFVPIGDSEEMNKYFSCKRSRRYVDTAIQLTFNEDTLLHKHVFDTDLWGDLLSVVGRFIKFNFANVQFTSTQSYFSLEDLPNNTIQYSVKAADSIFDFEIKTILPKKEFVEFILVETIKFSELMMKYGFNKKYYEDRIKRATQWLCCVDFL